jgi:hypothetical protein
MDVAVELVNRVRDHYVDLYLAFLDGQRRSGAPGVAEVMFEVGPDVDTFQKLYRIDFIRNDKKFEATEIQPGYILTFHEIVGAFGAARLSIQHLRWDDVVIHHDSPELPHKDFSEWFRLWFDPDDERHDPDALLSETVHSLQIQATAVSIDFGSAPSDAFWDMIELIERAGACSIRVTSSETAP